MSEMSDIEKVQEALDVLDPEDDAVWTTEDLPRVEVIAGLTGIEDLTRNTITQMFPDFVRHPDPIEDEEEDVSVDLVSEPKVMDKETYEGMIQELTEAARKVIKQRVDLLVQLDELNFQADALRDKLVVLYPPPTAAAAQKAYAASRMNQGMIRSIEDAAVVAAAQKIVNDNR